MSSSTFTLHPARDAVAGDAGALERAALVRDGFSWGAFVAPMLWLFWHRHWLAGIAALAIVLGFGAALWGIGARPGTILAAEILLHLLFGLEGASIRRLDLARRGRPEVDVVSAADLAEAETKAIARWLAPVGTPAVAPVSEVPAGRMPPRPIARGYEPVLGLFPDAEGRR